MRTVPSIRRDFAPPIVIGLVALGLWLARAAAASDPLVGVGEVASWLRGFALIATAAALVLLLERLAATLLFPPSLEREATGVQRTMIFVGLTLLIAPLTLSRLGVNPLALLATTTISTAALGLALQQTLAAIIGGLNMNLERRVRVGQRIVQDGAHMTITAMNLRNVVCRRDDGAVLIIPNHRLSDNALILTQESSLALEVGVPAPIAISPAQVRSLIVDVLLDMPMVEIAAPLSVASAELQPASSLATYTVTATLQPGADVEAARSALIRRLWYAYQRAGVPLPWGSAANPARPGADAWATPEALALLEPHLKEGEGSIAGRLAPGCELLMYGPGERLALPARVASAAILALAGEALAEPQFGARRESDSAGPLSDGQRRRVAASALGEELSALIGPYGHYAAWRAASGSASAGALRALAADEIADPDQRGRFLSVRAAEFPSALRPGQRLTTETDRFGAIVCAPNLRAASEVVLLALPPDHALELSAAPQ